MGLPFQQQRYSETVQACCLDKDLEVGQWGVGCVEAPRIDWQVLGVRRLCVCVGGCACVT